MFREFFTFRDHHNMSLIMISDQGTATKNQRTNTRSFVHNYGAFVRIVSLPHPDLGPFVRVIEPPLPSQV